MPRFIDEKTGVTVDTDGQDGGFIVYVPGVTKKPLELTLEASLSLSEQIGYAKTHIDLYKRVT